MVEPFIIAEITPQELQTRLAQGDQVVVFDLRQPWEYQSGHIPGARSLFIQEIPVRLGELPTDIDIVFQCWHGHTSLDVSAYVIEQGWQATHIASLRGGMAGWVQAYGPQSLEAA